MREILFRGQRIDNNEWVYGSLFNTIVGDDAGKCYIQFYEPIFGMYGFSVKPETVGQFTGLLDKNRKEIYEGDIVKFLLGERLDEDDEKPEYVTAPKPQVVRFENGEFYPRPVVHYCEDSWYSWKLFDLEVIGNIHENPDLIA